MKNLFRRWKATWNPGMYHGWGRKSGYFEGWYFKLVDKDESHAFAIIPGISKGIDGRHHSFIQVLDGKNCSASYYDFEVAAFEASPEKFFVQIGDNCFSDHHIELNLPELKGRIIFQNITPWPKMLGAPGIMGWYSFAPFMECYHGVISLHHRLVGNAEVRGNPCDFTGGTGYIEKDWGISFPRSWIWIQSNHFDAAGETCVMASVAHIPWLGSYFIGYITGFLWQGKLYRFATYTGAKMKAAIEDNSVSVSFRDKKHRLELTGIQAPGAELVSPLSGNMTGKVNESMLGTIHVRFFENEKLLFESTARHAGLEIAGQVEELLTPDWRR